MKQCFAKFAYSVQGVLALLCLMADLASFGLTISFIYLLYHISMEHHNALKLAQFLTLGGIIISKYLVSSCRLYLDVKTSKRFIDIIKDKFDTEFYPNNFSVISRLINRDITILLNFLPNISRLLYFPLALIIGFAVIYLFEGWSGVFALSTTFLFIALSAFIAKKSIKLAKRIYEVSKIRIDDVAKFLKYRPYLKNWQEFEPLKEIDEITRKEIRLRNRDSFWRCLDLYFILFGSALPVIIILALKILSGQEIDDYLVIVLWFATPMISLIMEMGRYFSDYTTATQAYKELQSHLNIATKTSDKIILDDSWDIWDGNLADNILQDLNPSILDLVTKLGLNEELRVNDNSCLDTNLEFLGGNISAGQKTRILLVRALNLAIAENKPLQINIKLNSLDPISCQRLLSLLIEFSLIGTYQLPDDQMQFLKEQTNRSSSYSKTHQILTANTREIEIKASIATSPARGFFYYYRKLVPNLSLLFLIPAIALSFNAYIIGADFALNSKLSLLLVTTIFSIIITSALGYIIENQIRFKAKLAQTKILTSATLEDFSDLQQRLSRDFTITLERISWYIHDISWYQSLIVVAFVAVIIASGFKGFLVNIIFIVIIAGFCRFFAKSIAIARRESIAGVNYAVKILQNLATTGNIFNKAIQVKRDNWIKLGFKRLIDTAIRMIVTKVNFSNIISASTGLLIVSVSFLSYILNLPYAEIIFVLNSLLMMENTIINLFQALTGLNAQVLSYERLETFPQELGVHKDNPITETKATYKIAATNNRKLPVSYKELQLEKSLAYSIVGLSGQGKTEFLQTISSLADSIIQEGSGEPKVNIKTLYLSQESIRVLDWLKVDNLIDFLKHKISSESYSIIILDEVLIDYALPTTQVMIKDLEETLAQSKASMLLVDHRFELDRHIFISNIIKA